MNRILRLTLINESAPTRINFNNVLWYSRPFKHQYYTEIKLIGEEYRLKVKETLEEIDEMLSPTDEYRGLGGGSNDI